MGPGKQVHKYLERTSLKTIAQFKKIHITANFKIIQIEVIAPI